jgi:hypothetical protein
MYLLGKKSMISHEIVETTNTTHIDEDWLAKADSTKPLVQLVKAIKARQESPKFPVDFDTFDMINDDAVHLLILHDLPPIDPVMKAELVRFLDSQKESYKENQQIQIIILDEYNNGGLCGCMGAKQWLYCPCDMSRNIYNYRYDLYYHYRNEAFRRKGIY